MTTCPITHEDFKDPVIASDGYTYERSAISLWLKKNKTSPISRKKMSARSLRPNRSLLDILEELNNTKKELINMRRRLKCKRLCSTCRPYRGLKHVELVKKTKGKTPAGAN